MSRADSADATRDFLFNQTMLRIKDPARSLAFYRDVLGMTLLDRFDFPDRQFSLYFMAFVRPMDEQVPSDPSQRAEFVFRQKATLELTHNWGTETDDAFAGYHHGNSEPRGFGHIGITVPDVHAAAEHFDAHGVEFVKRPDEGKMKGLAFIKDPDGYWIEILSAPALAHMIVGA